MFDHVALRVTDFAAAGAAYRKLLAVLGAGEPYADEELVEWEDFDLSPADAEHPVTTGVHVGFKAPDPRTIDEFWRVGLAAGFTDDGAPGPRPVYGDDYYGGFLRDRDGNSIEACVHDDSDAPGLIDHLWLRTRDARAARAFYDAVAPFTGFAAVTGKTGLVQHAGPGASLHLVEDGSPSAGLHLAFPADDDAVVRDFHAAALAHGAPDHGAPGERPEYHPGYYGAFVLDPDGHNVEVVSHNR